MKITHCLASVALVSMLGACSGVQNQVTAVKGPVDYVNPYMGNISHLLVPTFPTIHLPNSMLRVYPERADYTTDQLNGLPLIVTSHRGSSAFNLSPYQGENLRPVVAYSYDDEKLKPYYYEVILDDEEIKVKYAPSHQSALYQIDYSQQDKPVYMMINSRNGAIKAGDGFVSGYQQLENNTRVYLYIESDIAPIETGILADGKIDAGTKEAEGRNACAVLHFADGTRTVNLRYGISFISEEQAKENLQRELPDYNLQALAEKGRQIWDKALSDIQVEGGSDTDKQILYTSLYRIFERPVCISEGGRYFSAFDGKVHEDNGEPFYTDDWIWDSYRAAHPLRILTDRKKHTDIIVIADEIYEHINYIGKHNSIASIEGMKDRTVIVNGVSKAYAMTGWRIGFIAGPEWIVKAVNKLQGQYTSGPCSVSQKAAEAAYTGSQEPVEEMRKAFERRRDLIVNLAKEVPGFEVNKPEGAFYLFPKCSYYYGKTDGTRIINNADDLAMYLLEVAHVACVGGTSFGAPECIRMSYATSDENIVEAIKRIKDALAALK